MPARRKPTEEEVARTRMLWAANKPDESSAAPAYVADPPALWVIVAACTAALLLQSTLGTFLSVRGASFSFVTLVVAWYAVRTGSLHGVACGIMAGAGEDALAGYTGAAWTVATGVAGALAGRLANTRYAETRLALVPAAFAVTLVRYAIFAVVMAAEGFSASLTLQHVHAVLWQGALDALLALVLLWYVPTLGGGGAYRR